MDEIEIIEANIILSPIIELSSAEAWKTLEIGRFFNPITFELIGSWLDGVYMQPNLFSKEHEINQIIEVKDNKVIRVYKNTPIKTNDEYGNHNGR